MRDEQDMGFEGNSISITAAEEAIKAGDMRKLTGSISEKEYMDFLYRIKEFVLEAKKIDGDANDFHNFAVNFARRNDKCTACKILERGIDKYPYNVDLLADYLAYGYECDEKIKCKEYYNRLRKTPAAKMTWRGYDFAIDYLLHLVDNASTDKEVESLRERIEERTWAYKKRFPNNEDGYLTEAQVFLKFGEENRAIQVLKEAIDKCAAPKCCLRYAEIMMTKGKYDEVISIALKGISVSAQEQPSINVPYLFYLSGLAKDAQIHADGQNGYSDRERVLDVFSDYRVAESLFDESRTAYVKNLRNRAKILSIKSGISYTKEENYND